MRDLEKTIKDELTAMLENGLGLDDVQEMTSFLVVAIKAEIPGIEEKLCQETRSSTAA